MQSWITAIISVLIVCGAAHAEEKFSPRTGKTGEIIVEKRVNDRLRGLRIAEQKDHPCAVELYSDDSDKLERYINQCRDDTFVSKKTSKGRVILGLYNGSSGQALSSSARVTGLNVCLSKSGRVKGWTLYGPDTAYGNTISDSFRLPNCDDWGNRVNCPAGTSAQGIRAHFQPGKGKNSDDLRGMQLICR